MFMSRAESKDSLKPTTIRMFDREKFPASIRDEKWDLVKIVCKQPFNKVQLITQYLRDIVCSAYNDCMCIF